jgi:alpha-mannosidase
MVSITAIVPTYCFVLLPDGLAQVVWLTLESREPAEAEAWVEGAGLECVQPWRGTLPAGTPVRAEVAVRFAGAPEEGTRWPAVGVACGPNEARLPGELVVREPGWVMYLVSHFHYDPVWWNTQAGYTSGWDELAWAQDRREDFQHSGLVLVEAHMQRARLDPDYKFVLAEVDYLKPFWDLYPDRRRELRSLLAEGRLEIAGGMYNEPNTNLTSAETAIRSAVYGMGFQRDVLGANPETAWQLDVFGHDPSFPGIMADCGLTTSSWARGPFHQWGPKAHTGNTAWMQFPSEFEWISPNGQSLLTSYMPDHYAAGWQLDSAPTLDEAMDRAYSLFCDLAAVSATKATLLPVGTDYTPPNRWVTELARAWEERYAWPRFVPGLPREFFAAVRAEIPARIGRPVPQTRDMGPIYTGKDVSFIDTKQAQRRAETAILEAEKLASFALCFGRPYPQRALDKAWRQLVFNAHHDGITGSESDQVYLDLMGGWREAYELAAAARSAALEAIASLVKTDGPITLVVFNSLGQSRSDVASAVVELPEPGYASVEVRDEAGQPVPCHCIPRAYHPDGTPSAVTVLFRATDVPPLGYRAYSAMPSQKTVAGWAPTGGTAISNRRYRVEADPGRGGGLSRVTDLLSQREVIASDRVGNELFVYPGYPADQKWGEGPWHLLPAGPPLQSSRERAAVQAERGPLGERLVVHGQLDGMSYHQVVTLWAGSDRLDLHTDLHGFAGADRLVRLCFPTTLSGGTPLAEVGDAVIARSFALIDADSAVAPWTLDSPAQGWFGLGATLALKVVDEGRVAESRALGVAEVVVPRGMAASDGVRALLVALLQKGVTATCTEANANRYGGLRGDSNLPDFRICVGSALENQLVADVLESAGQSYKSELVRQLATRVWARLWVPASRPLRETWVPNADLRGPRDLPVLLVGGRDARATEEALTALVQTIEDERLPVAQPARLCTADRAATWTVGLLNRGTPGFAVDKSGALYDSLLRSCTGWPSGVWIDPPRRTAPDGSNFELEHWSHSFDHALVAGEGSWRALGCVPLAQAFNTPLLAWAGPSSRGMFGPTASFLELSCTGPGEVVLAALKPAGNPLASGVAQPTCVGTSDVELTVRLYEATGRPARARLRGGAGLAITAARTANMLEEPGEELDGPNGEAVVDLSPCEIRTVLLTIRPPQTSAPHSAAEETVTEPAQPAFSRYWLHNKGPAPMGNQLLAVHLRPSRVRLASRGGPARLTATVASDARDTSQAGTLRILAPPGWQVEPAGQDFDIAPGDHRELAVRLIPPPEAKPGRYFVAALAVDRLGHAQEDVTSVDLLPWHPLGPYSNDTGGDLAATSHAGDNFHPGNQASHEIEAELCQDELRLRPGASAALELVVANRASSAIRGEAQLVSPPEVWDLAGPWAQGFHVDPGGQQTVRFWARAPSSAAALSSWLLVKVMYFGRLWYSPAARFEVVP